MTYAEYHNITAVLDDRAGRRHAKERDVKITGTLELICAGLRSGLIEPAEAGRVIDLLGDHEAFLPCDGAGFVEWARAEGLLD